MGVHPCDHIAWRTIDGEAVVVDLRSNRMYGFNREATAVWEALEHGRPLHDLVRCLTDGESPPADPPPAVLDALHGFLQQLVTLGLAEGTPPTTGTRSDEGISTRLPYTPPQISWQQEVRSYGSSCGFAPGETGACDTAAYE